MRRALLALILAISAIAMLDLHLQGQTPPATTKAAVDTPSVIAMHLDPNIVFKTSGNCMPCHNSLVAPSGEDVSIGSSWRASMMANSARDPYWQAGVRRETIEHPSAAADIQDECSICHMPMARTLAHMAGKKGEIFAHLPVKDHGEEGDLLAHDGVSCALCHQIGSDKLGTPESFVGGYVIAGKQSTPRPVFGPFDIEKGLTTVMRSSAEFQPTRGDHIRQSELCGTCHTLYTKALNPQGEVVGQLAEQMMFLEWKHSAYETEQKSCQSCHMPVVQEDMPIASVLAQPRSGLARHVFVGGNFFMLRMLNRYRNELGVEALPAELTASAARTVANLQSATASVCVDHAETAGGRLQLDLAVQNLTGHKFPTAYPARRAWLHVTIHDRNGRAMFESGAIAPTGLIQGNDNDADATKFEPHYSEIRQPDQVQIYESIMGDPAGVPTTGLLTATRYLKDNRLLPRGFDKTTASPDIEVIGEAKADADFTGGGDRVRYSVDVAGAQGPFQVDVELRFQPIGYRWAHNLEPFKSDETSRFVKYYESMSSSASEIVAKATVQVP